MKKTIRLSKNKTKFALMVPLLALLLSACFTPWVGDEAELTIDLGTAGRAAVTPQEFAGLSFELILDGPGGKLTETISGSARASIKLLPGIYHITVRGTGDNPDPVLYAGFPDKMLRVWGTYTANVKPGQKNRAAIAVTSTAEVTNWEQLSTAITNADTSGRKEIILLSNSIFTSANTINIPSGSDITLLPDGTVTINRGNGNTVFNVYGILCLGQPEMKGSLTIDGLNIGTSVSMLNVFSGKLEMHENVTLIRAARGDNRPSRGGAVHIRNADFYMYGGTISYSIARNSGNNNNQHYDGGGGVWIEQGIFTMSGNAKLANNTCWERNYANYPGRGGGVFVGINGIFTMKDNAAVIDNFASHGEGSGVYLYSGATFRMEGGVISGNLAEMVSATLDYGGGAGLHVNGSAIFIKTGGIIYGNDAATPAHLRNRITGTGSNHDARGYAAFHSGSRRRRNITAGETVNCTGGGDQSFWNLAN